MGVYSGVEEETPCFETRGKDAGANRFVVSNSDGRKHLPMVKLNRAA